MSVQQPLSISSVISRANLEDFYNPLQTMRIKCMPIQPKFMAFVNLFEDQDSFGEQYHQSIQSDLNVCKEKGVFNDPFFEAQKTRQLKVNPIALSNVPGNQQQQNKWSFNSHAVDKVEKLKYPQTPHFKSQLQLTYWKFNDLHRQKLDMLQRVNLVNEFRSLPLDESPVGYFGNAGTYFVGLGMGMKDKGWLKEAQIFFKLACYTDPFNIKVWQKWLVFEEQSGNIKNIHQLAKTAFLFTRSEEFIRIYLSSADRWLTPLSESRGIMSCVDLEQPVDNNILVDLAKMHLKSNEVLPGLTLLNRVCQWYDFKLPVCSVLLFLARYLQNLNQRGTALLLLSSSFGRSMSKLQVYTTYIEMNMREQNGHLDQKVVSEVLRYIGAISGENRYKLHLDLAQVYYRKRKASRYCEAIRNSFAAARQFCTPGVGVNKVCKLIYYSLLKWKKLCPLNVDSDFTAFQTNRYLFLTGQSLQEFPFQDWKYCLHYGLERKERILEECCRRWPSTGRLVAEWIHCLRSRVSPQEMLQIWLSKIKQIPKSGQLLCEGGRIYAQLQEYESASSCFRSAIHFTPQYGDSFIEELRVSLLKGDWFALELLRKTMFVAEPFYGHVWSFIRESSPTDARLSLNQIWAIAHKHMIEDLSKGVSKHLRSLKSLTGYSPYNQAHANQCSNPQLRAKLFASYDHFDNKN